MPKGLRSLRETPEFTEHCAAIGEMQHIDAALNALTWALSNDAEQFPIIPGTTRFRLARTESYQWGKAYVPALKVWFIIVSDELVELRMITTDEDDETF